MKHRFPSSFYNTLTFTGIGLAGLSFMLILFLMALELFTHESKPYIGIITFVILPSVLLAGVGLVFTGAWRTHRRKMHGLDTEFVYPRVDMNDPRHFRAVVFIVSGLVLLVGFSAFGSYQAYEYTESDAFCGTTCHTVMDPEYTAYQFSPHARVGCVQCHIGSGASYFVKSKLSGTYQVYSVTFNKYPRPIPTPINNLRPAQETCEQCHWPKHFYSEKLHKLTFFLSDEKNTRWDLDLVMKIGGGNIQAGPTSGIHWHMNIAHEVTYATLDSTRQSIPWVKVKDPNGVERIYQSTDNPLSAEELGRAERRRMDCIDCHNRPSHIYRPPAKSVNTSLSIGWIDPELPNIKALAVSVLDAPYSSKAIALDSIKLVLTEYYAKNRPEVAAVKGSAIDASVKEIQQIYSRNYFPEMRVSWKRFPDNIGHMYYPGCFRCHDSKHQTSDGKVLSRECDVCHTILAQQFEQEKLRISLGGVEYHHPVDIGTAWKEMNCSDCHNPQ